jgi:hypothetical protein
MYSKNVTFLLLMFFLSACAGAICNVTYFPPSVDCNISGSRLSSNLNEFLESKTPPGREGQKRRYFTEEKIEEYKMVFYETGYLKELTVPPFETYHVPYGKNVGENCRIQFYQPRGQVAAVICPP